jgi:biotin-dependent carboxylase-like uncharacterized protein
VVTAVASGAVGRAMEVVRPGVLMTVQDLGRPGLGRFGISPAGAMDPLALRVTNRLVGNAPGSPALEITGPGAELRFLAEVRFALGGADLGATLDGAPLPLWTAVHAGAGAVLRLPERRRGARVILALAGGVAAPAVLGSASADLDGGLGGGRIGQGQHLAIGDGPPPPPAPPPARLDPLLRAYEDPFRLRFIRHDDPAIPPEVAAAFAAASFRVSDRSNRTGYRLAGPVLAVGPAGDRLSEPLAPGTIQLPPDGQPILLMADRQTLGGYPRLGHLIAADRPRAAQLWPGDEIHFLAVDHAEAQRAAREQALALAVL